MAHAKLAVGLPVYNGENYLEQTLRALLSQSFGDFELVISDNASTDATPDVIEAVAGDDPRVTYVRQETNLGAAPNYNAAYRAAGPSDYFAWVAHDDLPLPRYFELCVAALDARNDAVVAFAHTMVIDAYGNDIGRYPERPGLSSSSTAERFADVVDQHSSNHPVFGVMRRSALDRTQLHGSYTGSDRTLLAELAVLGPFVEIPEVLFGLREHPERSVRTALAGGKTRNRDVWFDTSNDGKLVLARWQRLADYQRAIASAPVDRTERFRTYRELLRWVLDDNWKALFMDLRGAVQQSVGNARRRLT